MKDIGRSSWWLSPMSDRWPASAVALVATKSFVLSLKGSRWCRPRMASRPPTAGQDVLPGLCQCANRADVFTHVRTTWYYCHYCKTEKNFQRANMSGKFFLLDHEQTKAHKKAAEQAASAAGSSGAAIVPAATCQGIMVGHVQCSQLDGLQDALATWLRHGTIQCVESDPLSPAYCHSVTWQNDDVLVKSKHCEGAGSNPCSRCWRLATAPAFAREVIHWSARIHMVGYAKQLCEGTDAERREAKDVLVGKDVYQTRDGRRDIDKLLQYTSPSAAIGHVKKLLESIPLHKQTARLKSWIEVHVVTLLRTVTWTSYGSVFARVVRLLC